MVGHEASLSRLPRNESLFSVHRGKRMIMLSDKNNTLNIRSELFSKCRHRNSYKASNFKRARK